MSQQLSDPGVPSLTRSDLLVSPQHANTAPQLLQGPPESLYNSFYSQTAHDTFVDFPDSSLPPASFGARTLRTANAIGTQTGLNSITPRAATDADTLRNLDLNAQLNIGPPKSDLSSNVLPVPSQLAEAAGVMGPATLPPRRPTVEYGMLPQQNTPLIHVPPQSLQASVPTLTALPLAQSNLPASTIQPASMPQSPVLPSAQPPLSQQQILQLITSQSPSQSPAAAAQLAQLLQSPNAQPILSQLAAMMGSAQAAPPPTQTQEEISTIFVVGFPEDMTEREFQNMFTFCPGYEAATLKMPAKDTPPFPNGQSGASSGLRGVFSASGVSPRQAAALAAANAVSNAIAGASDPYNLVTVNSGGVVVDQGNNQTATTSSAWSTGLDDMYARSLIATSIAASNASAATTEFGGGTNPGGSNLQSRKQIIGFAKFRTRHEALEARDVLHGRRVDIEKGSVLKAEMAKKNLHTKRGVGSLQGSSMTTNATNVNNINGLTASGMHPSDNHTLGPAAGVSSAVGLANTMDSPLSIGAPGYSGSATSRANETMDPFKVTLPVVNAVPTFQPLGPAGAPTSSIGVPPHDPSSIHPRDLLYSRPDPSNTWTLSEPLPVSEQPTLHSGPGEPYVRHRNGQLDGKTGAFSPPSLGSSFASLPPRPASSVNSSSPPNTSCASNDTEVGAGYNSDYSTRSFSPNESMANSLVGGMHSPDSNMDAMSKVMQIMQGASKPSGPPLTEGWHPSTGKQMHALSGHGGESGRTGSDSSTGSRRNNTADQNPPINTLYVGNLPSSQAPQSKYLEEALLALFSRCPGYRKLCFRQKTNGPMCFVEFDDVPGATRALKEQYGNTLNGLVKGGIRLSYSKNPLGVRTAVPNGPPQPPSLVGSPLGSPTTQIPPMPLQFGMNPSMGSLHDVPLHPRGGLAIPGADLPSRLRNDEHPAAFASSPPNRLLASPPPISSGGGAFAAITSRSHARAPISNPSPSSSSIHQSFSFMPATSPPTAGPLYPTSTFQPFGSAEQTSHGQRSQFQ